MSNTTEPNYLSDFLKKEADNLFSREKVIVKSGQNLDIGDVIGKILRGVGAAPIPSVVGTGNGTMTNLKAGPDVQFGSYVIKCTSAVANGGVFSVTAPDGTVLPSLTLTPGAGGNTNYKSTHMEFTITDGSTDFAVDDTFTVVVTEGGTPAVVGIGNGTMSAVSMGAKTQKGTYQVVCTAAVTNGGTFKVVAPDGSALPDLVLSAGAGNSTSYTNEQINFTITDGSTDFAEGDTFNIIVGAGSGKVVEIGFNAVDGSEKAYGIMTAAADASAADLSAVAIVRDALIDKSYLAWPTGTTTGQKATGVADLAEKRIISRSRA